LMRNIILAVLTFGLCDIRLRYIGYLPWTRGCALGGCYGYYGVYGGCYWKEVPVADGRGGWARGVEKICN
ncbi:MAG: hypothetical protein WCD56_12680, partial [Pseudolabrys sp.]